MKKEYIKPVTKTIEIDDCILSAQSDPQPDFIDLVFNPTTEDEGVAE